MKLILLCCYVVLLAVCVPTSTPMVEQKEKTILMIEGCSTAAGEAHATSLNRFSSNAGDILKAKTPSEVQNLSLHLTIDGKDGVNHFCIQTYGEIATTTSDKAYQVIDHRGTISSGETATQACANAQTINLRDKKIELARKSFFETYGNFNAPRIFKITTTQLDSQNVYWCLEEQFVTARTP